MPEWCLFVCLFFLKCLGPSSVSEPKPESRRERLHSPVVYACNILKCKLCGLRLPGLYPCWVLFLPHVVSNFTASAHQCLEPQTEQNFMIWIHLAEETKWERGKSLELLPCFKTSGRRMHEKLEAIALNKDPETSCSSQRNKEMIVK